MCLKLQVMHVLICLFEIKFRFSRYNDSLNVSLYHIKGIFYYIFLLKEEGNETGQDYDGENDVQGFKKFFI